LTNTDVQALAISGTNLFAGSWSGVFLSTNNGTSWTEVNTGLTNTYVKALAISGTNLFAGTESGVFLSTDNGTSWTAANTGLANTRVHAFAILGTNIFAGTDAGVFRSTNNGTSWTATNLNNTGVRSFAVSGTNLFAGTWDGVFVSTDMGASWTGVGFGLDPFTEVTSLAVSDSTLFVGAAGKGVWRRPLSELVTSLDETATTDMPTEYLLHQNYPNPFNPSTTIEFSLPHAGYVTLKVYNVLGEEVAGLIAGDHTAGTFKATWDASDMPSGVYFYRLMAGDYVQTKKAVLMK
jgi:ligand-binding sensor domain-containing protein